jgi:hypothetical protein
MRIAYEMQMCEAAGGRAADVEMIPGGFIGTRQIRKVVKSPVTGRVVSVEVMGTWSGYTRASDYKEYKTMPSPVLLNVERLTGEAYRPPTDEELTAFLTAKKAEKAAKPKIIKPPLINPTEADAQKLQDMINAKAAAIHAKAVKEYRASGEFLPVTLYKITQATYSGASQGSYARAETRGLCHNGELQDRACNMWSRERENRDAKRGPKVCEVRITRGEHGQWPYPERIIVLTDKPQKPLPAAVWLEYNPAPIVPALAQPETVNA